MLTGGSEPSSTTIEWAMFELMGNPTVMEKAQAEVRRVFSGASKVDEEHLHELNYLEYVIKETLRLHPPAVLVPRETIERCVIRGYDIPVDTSIVINAWAIGRDSRYWADSEKFHPGRFINSEVDCKGTDFEFIPFGAGRRMCPGMSFAMSTIKLPLAHLLFHFDWKLPDGIRSRNSSDESFGLTVRLKDELYLIPVPYRTASMSM